MKAQVRHFNLPKLSSLLLLVTTSCIKAVCIWNELWLFLYWPLVLCAMHDAYLYSFLVGLSWCNLVLQIVMVWIREVAWRRQLPQELISSTAATVLPYGSFGLGVSILHSAILVILKPDIARLIVVFQHPFAIVQEQADYILMFFHAESWTAFLSGSLINTTEVFLFK